MQRNILILIIVLLASLLVYKSCSNANEEKTILKENSALIQEQIKNVGKLVVTEGNFSQVFNYNSSKNVFGDFFSANKKALVIVNTEVAISYDLSKLTYEIDEENKILRIKSIPKEEIKISPDFNYYDIQADYLNPFEAEDYNKIKNKVKAAITSKIENSSLKKNAKMQLLSELSKFYILTNSLGWTLQYNETAIQKTADFKL